MALPVFDLPLLVLLAVVFIAGVARGMAGFGSGMIVAPVAGALYSPTAALVIMVILDSLPTVPMTLKATKHAQWREVLPVFAGLFLLFPVGLYLLTHGNVTTLRWIIALAIFASVAVLAMNYRYRGPRNIPISLGAGGIAGILSGIAAIPGPPVVVYWLASDYPAAIVRANLMTFFLLEAVVSVGNLWWAGIFTRSIVTVGLLCAPVYFVGLTIGGRLFDRSSERAYRIVTFVLILAAAFLALPIFDNAFSGLASLVR